MRDVWTLGEGMKGLTASASLSWGIHKGNIWGCVRGACCLHTYHQMCPHRVSPLDTSVLSLICSSFPYSATCCQLLILQSSLFLNPLLAWGQIRKGKSFSHYSNYWPSTWQRNTKMYRAAKEEDQEFKVILCSRSRNRLYPISSNRMHTRWPQGVIQENRVGRKCQAEWCAPYSQSLRILRQEDYSNTGV